MARNTVLDRFHLGCSLHLLSRPGSDEVHVSCCLTLLHSLSFAPFGFESDSVIRLGLAKKN